MREVKEELHINKIKILEHFDSFISNVKIPTEHGSVGLILFVYRCKIDEKSKIKLSFEHTEYKWADIKEAKKTLSFQIPDIFYKKIR